MKRLALLPALLAAVLVAPAQAATKVVFAGYDNPPGAPPGTVPEGFFPDTVTVHAGDRVQWRFKGDRDVAFLAKHQKRPPFVITDPKRPLAPQNDAAGQPFWWGGQPTFLESSQVTAPRGGRSYPGSGWFNSGAPLVKPYTLRFLRTGTYRYQDPIHPGVRGTVKVVSKRSRVPTLRSDNALAAAEVTHATDTARALFHGTPPPASVVEVGREAKGVAVDDFFPSSMQIATDSSLTFRVPRRAVELHTVTLGPEASTLQRNLVVNGQIDPRAAYPSDPPHALPDYTGSNHGDGFLNSGLLDGDPRTSIGDSVTIHFTAPGTYTVVCLLHPGMTATVRVSG
jgi:plastocyanin